MVNDVKRYYAQVERDGRAIEVEITKRQYNRTEVGNNIEIFRDCKYTILK